MVRGWPTAWCWCFEGDGECNMTYNNNNNELQFVCRPVAVVILHVYKIRNWLLINLSRDGYMRRM